MKHWFKTIFGPEVQWLNEMIEACQNRLLEITNRILQEQQTDLWIQNLETSDFMIQEFSFRLKKLRHDFNNHMEELKSQERYLKRRIKLLQSYLPRYDLLRFYV
jgi:hypothetical protein